MKRFALTALSMIALTACAPQVPDSGQGYSDYMARRDQNLGLAPATTGNIMGDPVSSGPLNAGIPGYPVQQQAGGLDPNRPRGDAPMGIAPQSGEMIHAGAGPRGLSDEQNFDAVASRESIESDAERLRRQREQYVVVQPTALPQRNTGNGPNIVQFALSTTHSPGQKLYSRFGLRLKNYEAACSQFGSADAAQLEFLRRGGPERDPLAVDPDGDGFACGWDPRPFRIR